VLNIYHIESKNYVNGNGCRYVLWLQGCDLACSGCWNQKTWSFKDNILKSIDELYNEIKNLENNIDGVTFSGGEPFLQAKELSLLAKLIKLNTTLDLQIFTGFEMDEIINDDQKRLLEYTDILISGRYNTLKENNNQKVYHLNDNIENWKFNNSDIEVDIDKNGNLMLSGYPTNNFINNIKEL